MHLAYFLAVAAPSKLCCGAHPGLQRFRSRPRHGQVVYYRICCKIKQGHWPCPSCWSVSKILLRPTRAEYDIGGLGGPPWTGFTMQWTHTSLLIHLYFIYNTSLMFNFCFTYASLILHLYFTYTSLILHSYFTCTSLILHLYFTCTSLLLHFFSYKNLIFSKFIFGLQ